MNKGLKITLIVLLSVLIVLKVISMIVSFV